MNDDVLARIEKLMRLSENNPSKHEAEAAAAMAQKLADAYNIDIAGINADADARFDATFSGGLYAYQRSLFRAIAELNHCLYWSRKGLSKGEKYKHRLVGSRINVMLANQMAEYLQDAVEKITRIEYCEGDHTRYFKKDAHIYREGMVDAIVGRLHKKRREEMKEAREKRDSQGRGDGKSLILIDTVAEREERANYDFQYGEGAWDRVQQSREEARIAREKAEEEFKKWAEENPDAYARQLEEEAKRQRERAKREERNARRRKGTYISRKPSKYDTDTYWNGRDRGGKVGLDRQVEDTKLKGYIS